MLIRCPECQKEISDRAQNCPHCGYPISKDIQVTENTEDDSKNSTEQLNNTSIADIKKENDKLPPLELFFLIEILSVGFMLISLIIGMEEIGAMGVLMLFLLIPITLIVNIFYLKKSFKLKINRTFGVIVLCLNIFACGLFALALTADDSGVIIEQQTNKEKKFQENLYTAAFRGIEEIKSQLKSPSSFVVNEVYVKVEDNTIYLNGEPVGDFVGFYTAYIDFSAQNGLGGVNRAIASCTFNQDFEYYRAVGVGESYITTIDKIPKNNPNVYKLDVKVINDNLY